VGTGYKYVPPTPERIREIFGHAKTLGSDHPTRVAMDSRLEGQGFFDMAYDAYGQDGDYGQGGFLGYPMLSRLAQNGIVRACVLAPVTDMTRNWIDIVRIGKGIVKDDETVAGLGEAFKEFGIKKLLTTAAELTGFFGGCFIFIDTGADKDKLYLPLALDEFSAELGKDAPLAFTVVEPMNVSPGDYDSSDPISKDYFKPRNWLVMGRKVDASRLIRVTGPQPPQLLLPMYNFLGIPQAQLICDYVFNFQEDRKQASYLLSNMASRVLKADMNEVLSGGLGANFKARVDFLTRLQKNNGVLAIDKDREDFVKVEHSLGGVTDIVQQALELICAVNGTPVVKTLGLSPKGFNATGEIDLRNYYDRVRGLQSEQLQPALETILKIMQLHVYGKIDNTIGFTFLPLSEDDRLIKANIQKTLADTAAVYLDRGVVSQEEVRDNLIDDPESGFDDIKADDVPAFEEGETEAGPEEPVGGTEPAAEPGQTEQAEPAARQGAGESVQQQALNGAQVTSLVEIVTSVALGQLPRESGIGLMLAAFPITEQQAERIMGQVGRGFKPEPLQKAGGF
jgi:phage-related protein (TIGR01555 family)